MAINCYGYTKKINSKHETSLYATQKILFCIYFTCRLLLRCCHCINITNPIISTVVKIPSQATVQPIALQNERLNKNGRQYGEWIWIANLSLLQHTKTYQSNTYLLIPKSDCFLVRGVIADSKISSRLFLQSVWYMLVYLKTNKY
jgi:hypothetical protein